MKVLIRSPIHLHGGPLVWTKRFRKLLEKRGFNVTDSLSDPWQAALWVTDAGGMETCPKNSGTIGFRVANGYNPLWFQVTGKQMEIKHHEVNASIGMGLETANIIIYQSHWGKKQLDEIVFPIQDHYVIIPNGVDLRMFSPNPSNQIDLPVLGTVGLFRYRYRLESFLNMSLQLKTPHKLLIIGSMDKESKKILSRHLDNPKYRNILEYHPFLPAEKLPDYYRRMTLLIHPVMGDVCPNVVVEALACGIPVVAPEFGGTAELIGKGGVIFPCRPWLYDQEFTETLAFSSQLALEEWKELSINARLQAESNFDDQTMIDRYLMALNLPLHISQDLSKDNRSTRPIKNLGKKIYDPLRYVAAIGIRKASSLRTKNPNAARHDKPRIAFTLFDFQIGGIESWLFRLTRKLKGEFDFYFIATKVEKFSPRFEKIGKCAFIPDTSHLIAYLRNEKIDILQVHNERWPVDSALAAGVPRIIERLGGPRSWRRLPKYGIDLVIASSRMAADAVKDMIEENRIIVIYNGIDLEEVDQITPTRLFEKDAFIVGRTSRFGQGQNLQLLVQAISKLSPAYPNLRLALIGGDSPLPGSSPIEKELKGLARQLEVSPLVSFPGLVDEPLTFIKGFDVATCVSNDEGIPNSLLEAMACNKPVIATDVGAIHELIVDRKNGLLIPVGNLDLLCEMITQLISDQTLYKNIADQGRKTIEEKFNLAQSAAQYAKTYYELLR
jgi:glycosyltransferase involved in cell wall biosynthesis